VLYTLWRLQFVLRVLLFLCFHQYDNTRNPCKFKGTTIFWIRGKKENERKEKQKNEKLNVSLIEWKWERERPPSEIVFYDIEKSCHLTEKKNLRSSFFQPFQQLIQQHHFTFKYTIIISEFMTRERERERMSEWERKIYRK
jgi:hypothetical protein